jgi:hypothetical protein
MKLKKFIRENLLDTIFEYIDHILSKQSLLKENLDPSLQALLKEADELVFEKFKINPSEKKYFLAGSAKLYTAPELKDVFDIKATKLGDLDIVIPNKKDWDNAGLGDQFKTKYEASDKIEVFSEWDPKKAGEKYADLDFRSTEEIFQDATKINGYWFMALKDVTDYKLKLDREKEQEVNSLTSEFDKGGSDKVSILRKIIQTIGPEKAKEFLKEED